MKYFYKYRRQQADNDIILPQDELDALIRLFYVLKFSTTKLVSKSGEKTKKIIIGNRGKFVDNLIQIGLRERTYAMISETIFRLVGS